MLPARPTPSRSPWISSSGRTTTTERFPPPAMYGRIASIDPGLLHCPQVRNKGGNNYGYNNLLGGLALGDIDAPDQTRAHR